MKYEAKIGHKMLSERRKLKSSVEEMIKRDRQYKKEAERQIGCLTIIALLLVWVWLGFKVFITILAGIFVLDILFDKIKRG